MSWQDLCRYWCSELRCPADIALATVEAETNGSNETGDNGNALGFGNVWPSQHWNAFLDSQSVLGYTLPSQTYSKGILPELTTLVLGNDNLSMYLAIYVIKNDWDSANGNWDAFTEMYVGILIPNADRERRRVIWNKYHNSDYSPTQSRDWLGTSLPNSNKGYYSDFTVTAPFHSTGPSHPQPHTGMDLAMNVGTIVRSLSDGVVTVAGDMGLTGWTVEVQSSDKYTFIYGHLSQFNVSVGDAVVVGSNLGLSGGEKGAEGSGNSTGPHLHLGVKDPSGKYVDPATFINNTPGSGSRQGDSGLPVGSDGTKKVQSQNNFFGLREDTVIPDTNFQVIPGSGKIGDILFGRRYRIFVSSMDGEKALDVSDLHCKFSVVKTWMVQPNQSEVTIYNLSPATENAIIKEGYRVVIEAGYEGSQYGLIFDGNVLQPIREKEEGTTYKLTLISMDSDIFYAYGWVGMSLVRGQNSRSQIEQIVQGCTVPSQLGSISENLSQSQLTRGKVLFGMGSDYLRQIALSEMATYTMEDGKVNIIRVDDLPEDEITDLTPSTGLVGVPTQNEYGANIKCLLNPRIKLGSLVHVDNSLIRNQQRDMGQPIYQLDKDGLYRVIKITYTGDTRGNEWYSEFETVGQAGMMPAMIYDGGKNPF